MRAVDVRGRVFLEIGPGVVGRLVADGARASLHLDAFPSLRVAARALGTGRQRRARLDATAHALRAVDLTVEVKVGRSTVAVAGAAGAANWAGRVAGLPLEIRAIGIVRAFVSSGFERTRRRLGRLGDFG